MTTARAEALEVHAALEWLCDLKKMKIALEASQPGDTLDLPGGKVNRVDIARYYETHKEEAWEQAFRALKNAAPQVAMRHNAESVKPERPAGAAPIPSSDGRSKLADVLEQLGAEATEAPWAWDQRGEKINEWGLGIALRSDETPIAGRFTEEDVQYVEQVCQTEGATVNYSDPDLICTLRNNLPDIIAALRGTLSAIAPTREKL